MYKKETDPSFIFGATVVGCRAKIHNHSIDNYEHRRRHFLKGVCRKFGPHTRISKLETGLRSPSYNFKIYNYNASAVIR
jgi:hypothetical protein